MTTVNANEDYGTYHQNWEQYFVFDVSTIVYFI